MFTGIIEELGAVKKLDKANQSAKISISAELINQDLRVGDSVAVNGVCLTIIDFSHNHIVAEVMYETLDATAIGGLRVNEKVNLERALRPDSRMGGHIVTGHVDGTGKIASKKAEGIAWIFDIEFPRDLSRYIAKKGSVAIDGISLTVVSVEDNVLRLSLIPHSISMTTLGFKKEGDLVNIEIDVLARYIERLFQTKNKEEGKSKLSESFLAEHGFM